MEHRIAQHQLKDLFCDSLGAEMNCRDFVLTVYGPRSMATSVHSLTICSVNDKVLIGDEM